MRRGEKTAAAFISVVAAIALIVFSVSLFSCAGGAGYSDTGGNEIYFVESPGIYDSRFELHIGIPESAENGTEIRYTTDSRTPTADSRLYDPEKGIDISYRGKMSGTDPASVNIIRCAAFLDGEQVGKSITGTFIVTDSPDVRYSTMIVSLVAEPDDLYGYERGILVEGKLRDDFLKERPAGWKNDSLKNANFFQKGREWERPIHAEFYTKDGQLLLEQDLGVRVSGGWNRNNAHKSLRLFARYEYDDTNVMTFDAYPGLESLTGVPVGSYKTLILRTGSNNMWNSTISTPYLMSFGRDLGLDTMDYRPVCVYLNGKYYGFMALLEDYSPMYFETNYNIPADEITCIDGAGKIDQSTPNDWELDSGPESELEEFRKMLDFIITSDMTNARNYLKACEMLDIESFVRYMCFEAYICNTDWPQNNVRAWRCFSNGYQPDAVEYGRDGRWRFLLKDLDMAAGFGGKADTDVFERINSDDNILRLNAMFKSLFKNDDFRNRVYRVFCDLISRTLTPENAASRLGEIEASALFEMNYYTTSWNVSGGSRERWHEYLSSPAIFFRDRSKNVRKDISDRYGSSFGELAVSVEGEGTLTISSLDIDKTNGGTLEYLIGLNIPVSASSARGWRLKELKIDGETLSAGSFSFDSEKMSLRAVFEPDPDFEEPIYPRLAFTEARYEHSKSDDQTDLVEILNTGDKPLYLKGYTLVRERTDENGAADRDEWDFPAQTIAPGEYAVIYCDKSGTSRLRGEMHASFGLKTGDRLAICDRLGQTVDEVSLPACSNYTVYALDLETCEWYYEPHPTFGEENVRAGGYRLADVIDGRCRGVYILNGKVYDDFADSSTVSERSLITLVGDSRFKRYKTRLSEFLTEDGRYSIDESLSLLGYQRFYIPTIDSYAVFKMK